MVRRSVRRGEALLAGLLRCGHCGRRLEVGYSGTDGFCVRYKCRGAHPNHGTERCISFGGMRVDAAVTAEVLRRLAPLGIEAALQAIAAHEHDAHEARRQGELALAQARYEADLARRQYDAVDPGHRLVAAELERRWNERLAEAGRLEEEIAKLSVAEPAALSEEERRGLMALGADLERAWHHPGATARTRKQILRTVLEEIMVRIVPGPVEDTIELVLHWQGGDHTRLAMAKNRTGQHRWRAETAVGELIRTLARQQTDGAIAATLNRIGKRTGKGNSWTEGRVRSHRKAHGIPVHRPGEIAERGELSLEEAAERLRVSKMTVLRLIGSGTLQGVQACKGAPWAIPEAQLAGLDARRLGSSRPVTADPRQEALDFQ